MTMRTGSSSATLTLGKTENAVVFAKDASRPIVFTVAPTLRTDVVKDVADSAARTCSTSARSPPRV